MRIYIKQNYYSILALILIILMSYLTSCAPTLTLTEKTGSYRTKTINYGTDLIIKNDTIFFKSKKGTLRCIDLNQYDVRVKNNGKAY